MPDKPTPLPAFSDELIRDVSELVYRARLGESDTTKMIAEDGDQGEKLRKRAQCYDALTKVYLTVIRERALKRTQPVAKQ